MSGATSRAQAAGMLAAAWGIGGVLALLVYAIVRLGVFALALVDVELGWHHVALLAANVAFMAYSEGYRGFQRAFAPRTVARARHLRDHPSTLRAILAPLFCMGFFHATRRRLVGTYALTTMIAVFVAVARSLDQPWRGILDAGVVVGLAWGVVSLVAFTVSGFASDDFGVSPELPGGSVSEAAR